MPEENIEVVPSAEDGGNGLPPTETPSEQPKAETPTEPKQEAVPPTAPTEELIELPDGRKVDAQTLAKEWKENFMPDYTKKSQALAAKEHLPASNKSTPSPYESPDYVPQSYEEIIKAAEERVIQKVEERERQAVEARQAVENEVVSQLEEIKKSDPTLNENALFQHATKYGFNNLVVAYKNMKDMADLTKNVQQTTAKNIAKRSDPVSIIPGANGVRPDPSNFSTATEYLRSLK